MGVMVRAWGVIHGTGYVGQYNPRIIHAGPTSVVKLSTSIHILVLPYHHNVVYCFPMAAVTLSQTQWLNAAEIYFFRSLEVRNPRLISLS